MLSAWIPRRLLITTIACSSVAAPARAEEPEALTAEAFLERVGATQPRRQEIAAGVDVARAEIDVAGVRPNPSVAADREETFASGTGSPGYVSMPGSMTWLISMKRGRFAAMPSLHSAPAAAANNIRRFIAMPGTVTRRRGNIRGSGAGYLSRPSHCWKRGSGRRRA